MKPFNLERALAGDPVVTRKGDKVKQIFYFDKADTMYPVVANLENCDDFKTFSKNGGYYNLSTGNEYDLFMEPIKNIFWVNVYKYSCVDGIPQTTTGRTFVSFEEAKHESIGRHENFVKTISFEIEI